ncbi:MAG TPA: hypothetical protein VGX72_05310 [Solirubrobacteraceae bacterium]|jgi:hypothetical protein|nr:hypothetical protein [Solirubrobacteraceae bacterium]
MSTRPSRQRPAQQIRPAPADIAALRIRRRQAQRKRRLARVDLGLGVFAGLMLLIISPGLAISGLVALLVLTACAISVLAPWYARRRRAKAPRARHHNGEGRSDGVRRRT